MSKTNDNDSKNQIFKDEEGLLLNHNYDGIQELDHPLPKWWLTIFYVTIAFSVVYVGYYMVGSGPSLKEEFLSAWQKIEEQKGQASPDTGLNDDIILASFKDPEKRQLGSKVYTEKCAACHGQNGEGLIGPNLTDDAWLHGDGMPASIAKVIRDGVAEKGMPPWGPVLTSDELVNVTAFVRGMHGTKPANAKEPQGQTYEYKEL